MENREEENTRILTEAYRLWDEKSPEAVANWMSLMAEEVDFRSAAENTPGMRFARTCSTRDEVLVYLTQLGEDWELIYYKADEFIAQGDRVVMVGSCSWKHRETGKTVVTPKVDVVRMKEGKIVGFLEVFDTATASAATQP